nr:hypothetical protein [Tanacetum cinerariifolium]
MNASGIASMDKRDDVKRVSVKNLLVSAIAGEATGDGTVSGIMGDEIGKRTIDGAEETGSKPEDHSGDGGF